MEEGGEATGGEHQCFWCVSFSVRLLFAIHCSATCSYGALAGQTHTLYQARPSRGDGDTPSAALRPPLAAGAPSHYAAGALPPPSWYGIHQLFHLNFESTAVMPSL